MPNFYINFLNKTVKSLSILCGFAVAPFTGAWIKIYHHIHSPDLETSHPSRVRGLKLRKNSLKVDKVVSCVDAWIKI